MARADTLRVDVVYCPGPGKVDQTSLTLASGSSLAQALQSSGVLLRHALDEKVLDVGVWCRAATLETPLRDRDRVEIYRPLRVDPKEARRQRYKRRTPVSADVSGSRTR